MRARRGAVGLSLLDVISCALGAAVLLAVIFSRIETPTPSPVAGEFILVEVNYNGEADLGFIVETSGKTTVVVPEYKNKQSPGYFLESEDLSESVEYRSVTDARDPAVNSVYLVIEAPASGIWKIRPFFYDFYGTQLRRNTAVAPRVKSLKMNIWSRQGRECRDESDPLKVMSPGSHIYNKKDTCILNIANT
jgi:hypothetical protein